MAGFAERWWMGLGVEFSPEHPRFFGYMNAGFLWAWNAVGEVGDRR